MSTTMFEKTMIKVHNRRHITPNQNGRKSPLRREVEIEELDLKVYEELREMENVNQEPFMYSSDDSDSLDVDFELNDDESDDECDLEVRNILLGSHSDDSEDLFDNEEEEIYQFERSKCPDFFF